MTRLRVTSLCPFDEESAFYPSNPSVTRLRGNVAITLGTALDDCVANRGLDWQLLMHGRFGEFGTQWSLAWAPETLSTNKRRVFWDEFDTIALEKVAYRTAKPNLDQKQTATRIFRPCLHDVSVNYCFFLIAVDVIKYLFQFSIFLHDSRSQQFFL